MKKVFFLIFLFGISFVSADAQILKNQKRRAEKRSKQRAKNKAQNKVDSKVDRAVDDTFNKIEGLFKKKKKNQKPDNSENERTTSEPEAESGETENYGSDIASMIMGGKSPSALGLPNQYAFDTYVKTIITSTDKKGKSESHHFNYLLPESTGYMGYEVEEMAIGIMDMDRQKIVSIVLEQNMATVMDLSTIGEIADDYGTTTATETASPKDLTITKTGKTKVIAGYKCEQYLIDSEETEGEMWKALDFDKIDLMKMGTGMGQMFQQNKSIKVPKEYMEFMNSGFLFEGTFLEKASNEKTHLIVESVASKKTDIDLQDYKIMDMSRFMKK